MVSRRPGRWLATAVQLLGFMSAAEAINLSQFQAITPGQIPANCLEVYTSVINGCVQTDFTNTGSCSSKCMQGIQTKQSQIQVFCANLVVNPKSLLGLALSGDLLELLCPGQLAPSIPGFQTIPAATSTRTTVQPPPPPATTATTPITTTTTRPTSTVDPKNPVPTQNTTTSPVIPSTTLSTRTTTSSTSAATSTQTTVTPPSTTTAAQADPAPTQVDPPVDNGGGGDDDGAGDGNAGNGEPVEVIQQNGSPFANINFAAAAGSEQNAPRLWSVGVAVLLAGLAMCA